MISHRLASLALAAITFLLGATPAHAYMTPDAFIESGGGTPEEGAGDAGNVPLPSLTPPPAPIPIPMPAPAPTPVPSPSKPKGGGAAPVIPFPPENQVKEEEASVPVWNAREEERLLLRKSPVHSAAPEMPHTAAMPLASSGLPLALPLVLSALWAGSVKFMKRKGPFSLELNPLTFLKN